MAGLERRLAALENAREKSTGSLSVEALGHLSDEDLDALEEVLETELEDGKGDFWSLYEVVGERGRRSLEAYFEAYEAAARGEEPPSLSRDPPAPDGAEDVLELMERAEAGDEEARRKVAGRNGYRIWKHYKK